MDGSGQQLFSTGSHERQSINRPKAYVDVRDDIKSLSLLGDRSLIKC